MVNRNLGQMKEARAHMEAACKIAPEARQCAAELDRLKQ